MMNGETSFMVSRNAGIKEGPIKTSLRILNLNKAGDFLTDSESREAVREARKEAAAYLAKLHNSRVTGKNS